MLGIEPAIGNDEDAGTLVHMVFGLGAQRREAGFDALPTPGQRIADVELGRVELVVGVGGNPPQFGHVVEIEHRLRHLEPVGWIDLVDAEQVRLRADEGNQGHHQLFADRIDRWIGHLCEELPEVVEQRFAAIRQDGQR
ncbi:MAG: hypothetical protein AW07_00778 [Candidatus Accumulibacter sp. SK-11]|nr:MAG: hypothetical protein AW07_00778 [Candidatus Accumulibacter sp. SK-11]